MVYALGIDLVEITRIEKIIKRWDDRFIRRVFTKREIEYCRKKPHAAQHYAARFAAKEAFLKCLGLGIMNGVALHQIEVINDRGGQPHLVIYDRAKAMLDTIHITNIHISITHSISHAAAVVALEV